MKKSGTVALSSGTGWRTGMAVLSLLAIAGWGCEAPPDDEEQPGVDGVVDEPAEQAPGGAFLDYQCKGKHHRHAISSFTDRGAHFTKSGGTEVFEHLDTSCNRVEVDTNSHYKSGTHVFEGEVKIGKVSGQSVVQIFNAPRSGPLMMIKAFSADRGTLRKLAGSVTLITGVTNEFVKVRIVHDVDGNNLDIFINGKNEFSGSGGKGGSFNIKYGNYGTGAPTRVTWRNVSF